jgi:hypothetical protein
MLQLINSIKIFSSRNVNIVVYDLGLSEAERDHIYNVFPDLNLKKFDYSLYPAFYDIKINAGEYAWKSAIIKNEYEALISGDFILWLDAGCFVFRKLNILKFNLFFYKIFSPPSRGNINDMTHPHTIEKIGIQSNKHMHMLSGGIMGFKKSGKNTALINEWYSFSSQQDVIAPMGSNRLNHRQDQSIFSLLFYKYYKNSIIHRFLNRNLEILPHKDIG